MTPLLDFYNVMTYDFHGAWTNHSGHTIRRCTSARLTPARKAASILQPHHSSPLFHVPAEKINLGTAFYGYAFDVYGLWSFVSTIISAAMEAFLTVLYSQVESLLKAGDWIENFYDLAAAPYLLNADGPKFGFITYDNPSSTSAKVDDALEKNATSAASSCGNSPRTTTATASLC